MEFANSARITVIKMESLNFHNEKEKKNSAKGHSSLWSQVYIYIQDGKIEKISCANPQT